MLPGHDGRDGMADLRALENEQGRDEICEAQDPAYHRDLANSQDPFDVALTTEQSIPTYNFHEGASSPDDPFKDTNLFKVSNSEDKNKNNAQEKTFLKNFFFINQRRGLFK